jgi:chorismate mutase
MSEDPKTYAVGYGRPPLHSRFIKGQSGNPSGRKKGARTLRTIVEEEGEVIIRIIENGRRRKVTKKVASVKAQYNKSIKGDTRAFANIERILAEGGGAREIEAERAAAEPLSEAENEVYERFLARHHQPQEADDD